MQSKNIYVLDTNVFIEAARRYYAFDIAQPFWNGLLNFAQGRRIISIDKVYNEIMEGKDELTNWAKNKFHNYFDKTNTTEVLNKYAAIIQWADSQFQYTQSAKDEFYKENNADTWVIAYAYTKQYTIVTHEVYNQNIRIKIPIPNVCKSFNISYTNTFEMLRNLNFQFQ